MANPTPPKNGARGTGLIEPPTFTDVERGLTGHGVGDWGAVNRGTDDRGTGQRGTQAAGQLATLPAGLQLLWIYVLRGNKTAVRETYAGTPREYAEDLRIAATRQDAFPLYKALIQVTAQFVGEQTGYSTEAKTFHNEVLQLTGPGSELVKRDIGRIWDKVDRAAVQMIYDPVQRVLEPYLTIHGGRVAELATSARDPLTGSIQGTLREKPGTLPAILEKWAEETPGVLQKARKIILSEMAAPPGDVLVDFFATTLFLQGPKALDVRLMALAVLDDYVLACVHERVKPGLTLISKTDDAISTGKQLTPYYCGLLTTNDVAKELMVRAPVTYQTYLRRIFDHRFLDAFDQALSFFKRFAAYLAREAAIAVLSDTKYIEKAEEERVELAGRFIAQVEVAFDLLSEYNAAAVASGVLDEVATILTAGVAGQFGADIGLLAHALSLFLTPYGQETLDRKRRQFAAVFSKILATVFKEVARGKKLTHDDGLALQALWDGKIRDVIRGRVNDLREEMAS